MSIGHFDIVGNNLITKHNAGFFSCCTLRLSAIVEYINQRKSLPENVISTLQFHWYKSSIQEDLTERLFQTLGHYLNYSNSQDIVVPWSVDTDFQYTEYKDLDKQYNPLVYKYFTPSFMIQDMIDRFIEKYEIDYHDTCAVFYRGNDKIKETSISPYNEFIDQAKEIKLKNPDIKFLVQPDEIEFLNAFKEAFPNDTICFGENRIISKNQNICIPMALSPNERTKHAFNFLATTWIQSQCKYLITHSGNGGVWCALYRNNKQGIHQYLNGKWIIS